MVEIWSQMGRIVKGMGRVVPAAVLSAEEEAAKIRALLAEEVATVREGLEATRAEAERAGRQAGFEAGRQEGLAQATEILAAARAVAVAAEEGAKDAALVLARRMAEKVMGRAIELDPALTGEIVAQALAASRARAGTLVLRVHPDDLAAVERERPRWIGSLSAAADVRVLADPAVGRHGCVVETAVGRLDARLQTQLDALDRALRARQVP